MSLQTTGVLHLIKDEEQITDSFKKREFVLKIEDGNYEQFIMFQLTQDRVDLIDRYKEGDSVEVHFNLTGKPFTNKEGVTRYFNNLTAWRISKLEAVVENATVEESDDVENLPF